VAFRRRYFTSLAARPRSLDACPHFSNPDVMMRSGNAPVVDTMFES
jgi:hypothetical protein